MVDSATLVVQAKFYFATRRTVESKVLASCISVETNHNRYGPGFQVCSAPASQEVGVHYGSRVDACDGDQNPVKKRA
jgi:hypothetical protein